MQTLHVLNSNYYKVEPAATRSFTRVGEDSETDPETLSTNRAEYCCVFSATAGKKFLFYVNAKVTNTIVLRAIKFNLTRRR